MAQAAQAASRRDGRLAIAFHASTIATPRSLRLSTKLEQRRGAANWQALLLECARRDRRPANRERSYGA
jgi:hypothetical protein